MYTPINKFKLNAEGKRLFERCESLIKNPFYNNGNKHNIYHKRRDFELLLSGTFQENQYKNEIPFGDHSIVMAGK